MLFRGKHDIEYLKRLNKELIEHIIAEKITYYPISKKFTTKNIYGEAKDKNYDPPVDLHALVRWGEQTITTTNFGQDLIYSITAFVLDDTLQEINLLPKEGDMVEYDSKHFEITGIEFPRQMLGREEEGFYVKLDCTTARRNVFHSNISGTPEPTLRTRPDNNLSSSFRYSDVLFPYSGSAG